MKPPKYSFYIEKPLNVITYDGRGYSTETGALIQDPNNSCTERIAGDGLVPNPETEAVAVSIYEYDADLNYLGNPYSQLMPAGPIYFRHDEAKYMALVFVGVPKLEADVVVNQRHSVTPHYKELSKKYEKEDNQEFFRTTLEGDISLFNSDFEYIYNSEIEDIFTFYISKYNDTTEAWSEYFKGQFSKTDCIFDFSRRKCTPKITALDEYNNVMDKYDNTYDLIKLAPEISKVKLYKRPVTQIYVAGANSIANFMGGVYWEADVNEAVSNKDALLNTYFFGYNITANEFTVSEAKVANANGVYAGTNGIWTNPNGYTCYVDTENPTEVGNGYIRTHVYIKDNNQNIVYRSVMVYPIPVGDADDIYLDGDVIWMVNTSNSGDSFYIRDAFVYPIYRRILCDVDSVETSTGIENTYDIPANDFVTDNRNYKKCIGLTGGTFYCSSLTTDEPTEYGQNDFGQYFTNKFLPPSAGMHRLLPVCRNTWVNASVWYEAGIHYDNFENKLRKQYILKDSYSIAAVIKALLHEIDPSLTHEATAEYSRFLYDSTVPISMERFFVYITPKTNILKGEYDQPAQKAEITFEGLMNMLRDCFRCYWYIEDGKFKIEHIRFFTNGGSYTAKTNYQLDFTKLKDQFNRKLTSYFQSELEYDKSGLSARYEFEWADDSTEVFGPIAVDVISNYVQKDKTETINSDLFSADVDFMLLEPSSFSEDGFALLCPIQTHDVSGSTNLVLPIIEVNTLLDSDGDTYSAAVQNWYASWIYLLNFYRYDMPATNIKCNAIQDTQIRVIGIKNSMSQTIEFPAEEDLDTLELVKTSVGNGKIDEMSINIDTRKASVKLLYRPK